MTDDELLFQFEATTLPPRSGPHRCHVKVAHLYLKKYPFAEAMDRMRSGVKAHNAVRQLEEGPASGYNETTTRAFVHLIAATMDAYGNVFPTTTADEFCDKHPQLLSKHVIRFFYSIDRRMDPLAKTQFVEPDLAPLPSDNGRISLV